jgi:hypothetical protein
MVDTASVCRIRFQYKLTSIGRTSNCERGTTIDRPQTRQAVLNWYFHMGTVSLKIEDRNRRVLAAFGDHPEDMLAVVRKPIQMNRKPSPP